MRAAVASIGGVVLGVGLIASHAVAVPPSLPLYQDVVGDEVTHVVVSGETLGHIAARAGIKTQLVAAMNQLADVNRLRLGQRLVLSNRHIVPAQLRDGIVINVGDLGLYWLRDGALVARFPVGVGRAAWATPPGHYSIVSRRHDPVWHVPRSIQKEMKEQGEPVKKKVPPGPDNPLGKYWLQLSAGGYGIHGTNAPWSVGKYTTHGCIRLRPDDIERLYNDVPNGTAVDVIKEPTKVARLADGRILLEVHRGVEDRPAVSPATVIEQLHAAGLGDAVDTVKVHKAVRDLWGVAVDVSKTQP